jgi:hypothetical protein
MPRSSMISRVVAGMALLAVGCSGQIGSGSHKSDPGSSGEEPPGPGNSGARGGNVGVGGSGGGGSTTPPADQPGTAVFRRLSRTEYNNTIRDLLGDNSSPANAFPPDTDSYKSGFFRGGAIAAVDAGRLLEATERLAGDAVRTRLAMLLPCPLPTGAAAESACAQQFITQFGRRAYRRPLGSDEARALLDYYTQQRAVPGQDFPGAVRMIVAAMLMSPNFLYRWELAPKAAVKDGALLRFNGYETASRLSYLFWASMPDNALLDAAEGNRLSTPEQLEAEARRLLKDPRARDAVADFFLQWLDVNNLPDLVKNTGLFTSYTPELAQSMLAETREFAANLVTKGDARLETLLTSTSTFLDARLAGLYKVNGVSGTSLAPASVDKSQRGGILTQASFLAAHGTSEESHPVKRGKLLADRLLCTDLPLPPDNVPDPKMPAANLSTRERYAEHGSNICAQACHSIIDPLGFAFEHYDAIGGWRAMDGGKAVDSSGFLDLGGQKKPFNDAMELSALLAQAPEVRECMARQWLRFALRRHETPGDTASVLSALGAFGKSGYDLRELMVALTQTRAFTHRTASAGEVLQ